MNFFLRLLLDPGRSLAGYILRVAPIDLGGAFLINFIGAFIPGPVAYDFGAVIEGGVDAGFIMMIVLAAPAVETLVLAAFVKGVSMAVPNPVIVALWAGAIAGALHLGYGPAGGLSAAWGFFVMAIAFHVGDRTSFFHGLAAAFLLHAIYNAIVMVLWIGLMS